MRQESRENFRRTTYLLARKVREEGIRSIVITAASPGAGATTTAATIAEQAQSLEGLRTLLVDMNRRRPSLAKRFKLDPSHSLASFAVESKPLAECVQKTTSGLSVLPTAPDTADLSTTSVERLLEAVKDDYDLVIFDTPPIMGYADSLIVGGLAPHVVLVVEAGRTPYEVIDRIKDELELRQINLLGAILNKHRRFIPGWLYGLFAR